VKWCQRFFCQIFFTKQVIFIFCSTHSELFKSIETKGEKEKSIQYQLVVLVTLDLNLMDKVVGVLGGGQLGRMFAEAANRLNIKVIALEKSATAPTKQITAHSDHISGSFKDANDIQALAKKCDVLTIEIEHVDADILAALESKGVVIEPKPETIKIIQDKFNQKQHLIKNDIPVAESYALAENSEEELAQIAAKIGLPFMLKARKDAYDGRGNYAVKTVNDFGSALKALSDRALYAEKWANFRQELAVMVVRTKDGAHSFPVVETIHENSICKLVYQPPRGVSTDILHKAGELAQKTISTFKGKGVYAVEMFLLQDDTLLVNEIAPRPHNSGHYTIEGCHISQYEAHVRAILDLPISVKRLEPRVNASIMLNILGGIEPDSHMELVEKSFESIGTVHLYGKGAGTPGRKLGHITITAHSMVEAETNMEPLIKCFNEIVPNSSSTDQGRRQKALVGVIMGSFSDFPKLKAGLDILNQYDIPHERDITSAHRTSDRMIEYAKTAEARGIRVIIAAAGGAAHLPGMVAANTKLPVIGIPIKASVLDGVDSLHSIVQMPRGEPVATVGIDNSTNAALLAMRILGVNDERIRELVEARKEEAAADSLGKAKLLQEMSDEEFLEKVCKVKK
jgi:phosphoribosylaminoimidazole carboxylase